MEGKRIMTEDVHRLRLTMDFIYKGPQLSPSACYNVAQEAYSGGQLTAFEEIETAELVYTPKDERVVYAHHHNSPEPGDHCRVKGGCITTISADGLNQDDL
jgi:hypothetical protein